jgi:hypothetical protein
VYLTTQKGSQNTRYSGTPVSLSWQRGSSSSRPRYKNCKQFLALCATRCVWWCPPCSPGIVTLHSKGKDFAILLESYISFTTIIYCISSCISVASQQDNNCTHYCIHHKPKVDGHVAGSNGVPCIRRPEHHLLRIPP